MKKEGGGGGGLGLHATPSRKPSTTRRWSSGSLRNGNGSVASSHFCFRSLRHPPINLASFCFSSSGVGLALPWVVEASCADMTRSWGSLGQALAPVLTPQVSASGEQASVLQPLAAVHAHACHFASFTGVNAYHYTALRPLISPRVACELCGSSVSHALHDSTLADDAAMLHARATACGDVPTVYW